MIHIWEINEECNIPPVEARAGTAFPRDVPRAVAERSEAEWTLGRWQDVAIIQCGVVF